MSIQNSIPIKPLSSFEKMLLVVELALIVTPVSFLFVGAAVFFLVIGGGIPHSSGGDMPLILFGIVLVGIAIYSFWHFSIFFLNNKKPPLMPWLLGLILAHLLNLGGLAIQVSGKYPVPSGSWIWRTVCCVALLLFLIHLDSLIIRTYRCGQDQPISAPTPRDDQVRPVPKGRVW